ncbi:hypothetical protein BJV82DRAFT_715971 [Fennellomyces sp. T-0311]|nr:hypothetical protein BJV82DRAFT_715971 [Fennellomyces sp. T-0311]
MLTTLAINCIMDHRAQIAKKAVHFFLARADDWRYVIPEAYDCLRECRTFCYIIDPIYRQEEEGRLLKAEESSTTAGSSSASESGAPSSSQSDGALLNNDSGIVDEVQLVGHSSYVAQPIADQSCPEVMMPPADSCHAGLTPTGDNDRSSKQSPEQRYHKQQDREQLYGEQAIVHEIVQRIEEAQKVLETFLYESKKDKKFFEEISWMFKRSHIAAKFTGDYDYREYFRTTSIDIRRLLNNLMMCQKLSERTAEPKLDRFKKDMSEEAYLFWKMHIGQRIIASWQQFIDAYILLYGAVDPVDLKYIETVLLFQGDKKKKLTVHGFINFTNQHSFPFPKNIATNSPSIEKPMSEEGRMDLTKMVMSLVTDFSSNEMRTHLLNVYAWYSGYKTTKEIQERANEWARLVKQMRDTKEKNPQGDYAEAEKVDMARRAIYFFYQRFMVMWRVGQVSRETLNNVDFPGRGRIRDFIRYVGPLDRANYFIVMGRDDEQWSEHKPQIYKFLEKYLKMLGDTSQPTSANGTNNPVQIYHSQSQTAESIGIDAHEQDVENVAVADTA